MQNLLPAKPLRLNLSIGSKKFAVPWDNENLGVDSKIPDFSLIEDDCEICQEKDCVEPAHDDETIRSILEDNTPLIGFKVAEPQEAPEEVKDCDPELYFFSNNTTAVLSTIKYNNFFSPVAFEEDNYPVRMRNKKQRIPLSRKKAV